VTVEKVCRDLCGRSKSLIKRGDIWFSPKCLLGQPRDNYTAGVELLTETAGLSGYALQSNSEYRGDYPGSESVGANVHAQKGKNPNRQLRPPSHAKCVRKFVF
jgi:hypothetical protein